MDSMALAQLMKDMQVREDCVSWLVNAAGCR